MRALAALLSGLLAIAPALAGDWRAGPGDYRSILPQLQPGDRLLLRQGDYQRGLPLHNLAGQPGRPIVIQGERGTRFVADDERNTISLVNVSHIVIRNLELDGRNQPVDAVKAEGHSRYAHFITLENLYIHDHANNQQNVGISSKCPAFGWVVRGNRIERVGTGMYFGNSDGSAPFVAGRIEGNRISDSIGYNLQIKHQRPRPPGMPEAERQHDTVISGNLFDKEHAWPDPDARPNVLVGHAPKEGPGALDRVLVHHNLFWQNPSEALFQGEGHLAIYDNLFVTAQAHAVHIQPHNDVPRQVEVFHNSIVARGNGIRILHREGEPPRWPQRVWGNLVFAAQPIRGGEATGNLTGRYEAASRYLKQPGADLAGLDLGPTVTATRSGAALLPDSAVYPGSERDYDGRPGAAARLGACVFDPAQPCPKAFHVQ